MSFKCPLKIIVSDEAVVSLPASVIDSVFIQYSWPHSFWKLIWPCSYVALSSLKNAFHTERKETADVECFHISASYIDRAIFAWDFKQFILKNIR